MPVVKSASGAIVGKCVGMLVGASEGGVVGEAQELGQSSLTVLVFLKPGGGGSAPQPSAHEALHGAPSCVTATSHGVPPRSEKVPSSFKTVIEHNEAASAVVLSNADAKIDRSPMWTQNANALRCCKDHSPPATRPNERTLFARQAREFPGIPKNLNPNGEEAEIEAAATSQNLDQASREKCSIARGCYPPDPFHETSVAVSAS